MSKSRGGGPSGDDEPARQGSWTQSLRHRLSRLRQRRRAGETRELLRPYFDATYYLARNCDVAEAGVDPLQHFLAQGWREGRDPSPRFSVTEYLARNPGLVGINPLEHFARNGGDPNDVIAAPAMAASAPRRSGGPRFAPEAMLDEQLQLARAQLAALQPLTAERVQSAVAALNASAPALRLAEASPDVSIIIPVHGQVDYALACIASLLAHESRHSAEIIVHDDASPTGSHAETLGTIHHIRYRRAAANGGYLVASNLAAREARGRYLVLLNSDTQVLPGWLDELIGSFALFPRAALVGSRLIYPDGRLQEAGSILWSSGEAWNYGNGADPHDPKYNFARQPDYCSAASVAVPRDLWVELGGFDPAFSPAYAEDADLAFRVRAAGREVWYQPLSSVIHHEGRSHGTDPLVGLKAHQVANLARLADRWQATISTHGRRDLATAEAEADRTRQRRILILDSLVPTPDRDSGSYITDQIISAYQQLGYRVTFIPQGSYRYAPGYTEALQRRGVECIHAPFATSIRGYLAGTALYFDAALIFRHHNMAATVDSLREMLPDTPIILHTVDLHFLRQAREAELSGSSQRRMQALRVKYTELEMAARADAVVVHTPVEHDILAAELGDISQIVFPYVAETRPSQVPFEARRDVVFLGGFQHTPNVDAVAYFLDDIWPLVQADLPPRSRFVIVGGSAPAWLRDRADERIVFAGQVADLASIFAEARVFVAPLRYGAGIKGKLIQAMAHGVPSVATSIAAEGIGIEERAQARIADDPAMFAAAIAELYGDEALWMGLSQRSLDFVAEVYSWQRCLDTCAAMIALAQDTFAARLDRHLSAELARTRAASREA